MRPIRREARKQVLGGVAAGVADSFGVDRGLVRIAFMTFALLVGLIAGLQGLLILFALYILGWLVLPKNN